MNAGYGSHSHALDVDRRPDVQPADIAVEIGHGRDALLEESSASKSHDATNRQNDGAEHKTADDGWVSVIAHDTRGPRRLIAIHHDFQCSGSHGSRSFT